MVTRLDDPPLVDKVDPVALLDAAQTMRDGDRRPPPGCAVQCILNDTFAVAVECRGRFIEQENRGVTWKNKLTGGGE
jgi:hypothetical protein